MTQDEINELVGRWLQQELANDALARTDVSFAKDWARPGQSVGANAAAMLRTEAEESLFHWREVIEKHDWLEAEPEVNALLAREAVEVAKGSETYRLLCLAICLASAELQGIRLERSLGHWQHEPKLFQPPVTTRTSATPLPPPPPTEGEALRKLIEEFLDDKQRTAKLRPKRMMDFEAALRLLARRLGDATPVNRVTRRDIGELRILLTKLPSNFTKRFPGLGLDDIVKEAADRGLPCLNPGTINQKYLALIDSFFEWCVTCGFATENPAAGVRVDVRHATTGILRGTFRVDELKSVFSAPLFVGCQGETHIYEAGPTLVRDHRYWLPLLGLFTGARLGELAQLHTDDIQGVDDIPCLSLAEEGRESRKTRAAQRTVPVHPELVRLGFLNHVAALRKQGAERLFPEIKPGKGGYLSENPSKWFARFLKKTLGSDTVRDRHLAFHSFRHTMKDALRAAGVEERIQDALLGHESDHVSAVYGEGYKAPRLYAEISKVRYEGLYLSLCYPRRGPATQQ